MINFSKREYMHIIKKYLYNRRNQAAYMLISLLALSLISFISLKNQYPKGQIQVKWVKNMKGDFSFTNNWSYPEGIYKNRFGQLDCDGICPPEIDRMKDNSGKILQDSLDTFYNLVDTVHRFHTISSEAWSYEWAGTNYIHFQKQEDNSIIGQTEFTVSSHSSLNIMYKNDSVTAWIIYKSIADTNEYVFPVKEGIIKIDREIFKDRLIKAEFDFKFTNTLDNDKEIFWKGLIYSPIK